MKHQKKSFKQSEKGMFWPFRLLIAAIMAFAILLMILGTINYFKQYKVRVSWERFTVAFEDAYNAPTKAGEPEKGIKKETDLALGATTLSSTFFAKKFGLPEDCITFQAPPHSPVKILNNGKTAELTQDTVSTAYFRCIFDESDTACRTHCYISFSLPPEIP